MKRELSITFGFVQRGVALGVIAATIVVVAYLGVGSGLEKLTVQTFEETAITQAQLVARMVAPHVDPLRREAVSKQIKQFSKRKNVRSISIVDKNRKTLYSAVGKKRQQRIMKSLKTLAADAIVPADTSLLSVAAIPSDNDAAQHFVILETSRSDYLNTSRKRGWSFVIALVVMLVAFAGSTYLFGRRATGPIREITSMAEKIESGDLRQPEFSAFGAAEITRLGRAIHRLGHTLHDQMLEIKTLTSEIATISNHTKGTMSNLATSATEQAAAVNETAATVEEMEKSGQSSAGNAKMIVTAAEKTAEASTRGRQTVEKTYDIIMQIKEDSQDISAKSRDLLGSVEEIGTIIQSVNSIAEQSKILAVNASIEAAKAGEFGSGFAVVAQEVKDLAQQSKDATVQITQTLTAIREAIETMVATAHSGKDRTDEGVNTIANAGAVMNDLSEAIRENSDFANIIATNIKQQTVGLTQIAAAIEEINTTALESQNVSRSIAEGATQMDVSIKMLTNMVERWKVAEKK